jgi:CDP-diglyceride synthetase
MFVNGLLWLGLSVFLLMAQGLERHGNYEYYGNYPVLYLVPGILGLLIPALLLWLVRPPGAAVGAVIALPFGTLLGYVVCWNAIGQSPAVGLLGFIGGAALGTLLGLLTGRMFSRRFAGEYDRY